MLESVSLFVAKTIASYASQKGLNRFFENIGSFENRLSKVIDVTIEEFKAENPIPDEDEKFAFYDSQIIVDELLKYRFFGSTGYQLDEARISSELNKNSNIIQPEKKQLESFLEIFDQKIQEDDQLKKLAVDENYKFEIFNISDKIDTLLYEGLQSRKLRKSDLITEKANDSDNYEGAGSLNVKPIANPSIKKINKILGGIIVEGHRNNILAKYSLEIINKQHPTISTLQQSKVAPDFEECIFRIKPDESVNIEFRGRVKSKRNDYTFSFVIYEERNYVENISISYSINSSSEKSVGKFNFVEAQAFQNIPSMKIKTYRPFISNYFSEIPEVVNGIVSIHNE